MKVRLITYGIAREITGGILEIELDGTTVLDLRRTLARAYPALGELTSLMVAVNMNYAADDTVLKDSDEIVLIPPVSGG